MRDVSEVSFRSRCAPIALALVAAAGANAGVLTTFNFQGSGAFLWNDLLAWDQGGFPNSLDHNAVIANNPGVATTLSLNTTISLNDLLYTSNDVQFINQGRQITLGNSAVFNGGQTVVFNGGTITGDGMVNNSGGFLANGNVTFSNAGVFTNNSLATFTVDAGVFTRNTGDFTNLGTINLTSSNGSNSSLTGNSLLLNRNLLDIQTGAGGGRFVTIDLTNDDLGVVNIRQSTMLNGTSGVYTNRGDFTTFLGSTATLSGTGTLQFNQENGVLLNNGSFVSVGETFNFTGGEIFGNDVQIQGGTLNVTATGQGNFDVTGNTTFTGEISMFQTIDVFNSTLTAGDFVNRGQLTISSLNGSNAQLTAGTLTNMNALVIDAGAGGGRFFNADLVNNGAVGVLHNLSLNKTNGVFTNNNQFSVDAGATVTVSGSGLLDFNQDAGVLNNAGAFVVTGERFNFNGGTITGNDIEIQGGSLNIATGNAGNFDLTGNTTMSGDISANQTVDVFNVTLTQGEFTNDGTLTLTSNNGSNAQLNATMLTNNGTLDLLIGAGATRFITTDLNNTGTVNANASVSLNRTSGVYTNSGQFNVAPGATTTLSGSGVLEFNQNAGALNNDGSFIVSGDTFNFNGGVLTGNDIVIQGGSLNIAGTGMGNFDLTGNTTMSGDISANQTVDVFNVLLTQTEFTNNGTLTFTSNNGSNAQLNATMLTNNGTLDLLLGAGATRFITTDLSNTGTVNANATVSLNRTNGVYTNSGQFNVAPGATTTLSGSGVLEFNQNAGALNNDGSFIVSGDTFNFNGGVLTGNDIVIQGGSLNIAGTGMGNFDLTGNTTMSGDISANQTVDVFNVSLTQGDFTNNGRLTLTSNNGSNATLNAGTFTNVGTFDLLEGAGASRFLNSNIENQGVMNVRAATFLNVVNGVHSNSGVIDISSNASLFVQGSGITTITNDTSGVIRGDGILSLIGAEVYTNLGSFAPEADNGASAPATLGISGDWSALAGAQLLIDLFPSATRGSDAGDRLVVTGDATLGGDLVVNVIGTPDASDTFVVLSAADVIGTFANALTQVQTTDGGTFDVIYTETEVLLTNYVPTPGTLGLAGLAMVAGLGRRRV